MTIRINYTVFSLMLFLSMRQLQCQNNDSLNSLKEKEIIKEYFKKQQSQNIPTPDTLVDIKGKSNGIYEKREKLKFIILCFNLSKSSTEEIESLNKLAKEYGNYISSYVIKAEDLNKYKEIFTRKELKSLQDFISNKSEFQKRQTSFPVILILDTDGQILNAWSGDKTEDGLKKEDYYIKIKSGLENISKQN